MRMRSEDIVAIALMLAVGVPFAALWAIALLDVFRRSDWEFPPLESGVDSRLFWTLVVVLLSGIGSFFYYFIVMKPHPRSRR